MDVVKYLLDTARSDVNLPDNKWGDTPLITACRNYSILVSMYLLKEVSGLDVNATGNHGHIALHYAVLSSKYDGLTQLHEACMKGDEAEVLRLVITCDHLINVQDNIDYTPLHWACYFGHSDIMKTLMLVGADETITDFNRQTPAQVAKTRGHFNLLQLLDKVNLWNNMQIIRRNNLPFLNNGERIKVATKNIHLKDVIELSIKFSDDVMLLNGTLIESCCEGHLDVVNWLVEYTAADVSYTGTVRGRTQWGEEVVHYYTPLTAACDYNHLDVVKFLVETSRVDVNLPDSKWGLTPLIAACRNYSFSVSMYLLSEVRDLNVNTTDNHGYTALHFTVTSSKDNGNTELHEACMKGDVTEVMRLVHINDHKIDVQDNIGYTPLHYACRFNHRDIVKTLMLWGADETVTDDYWLTPAQVAKERGHRELLPLLDRMTCWEKMHTNYFNN